MLAIMKTAQVITALLGMALILVSVIGQTQGLITGTDSLNNNRSSSRP